jgi:hypothetical protein
MDSVGSMTSRKLRMIDRDVLLYSIRLASATESSLAFAAA